MHIKGNRQVVNEDFGVCLIVTTLPGISVTQSSRDGMWSRGKENPAGGLRKAGIKNPSSKMAASQPDSGDHTCSAERIQ